jgi:hypothetical protein
MPKQSLSIRDFVGGLVQREHGQDQAPTSIATGMGFDINRNPGILGLCGAWEIRQRYEDDGSDDDLEDWQPPGNYVGIPGRGLHYFTSDYDNLHGVGSGSNGFTSEYLDIPNCNFRWGPRAITNNPTEYYALGSKHRNGNSVATQPGYANGTLHIYERDIKENEAGTNREGGWLLDVRMGGFDGMWWAYDGTVATYAGTALVDEEKWAETFYPVYYTSNGAIRISDGGFNPWYSTKLWLGYVKSGKLFSNTEGDGYVFPEDKIAKAGVTDDDACAKTDCWVLDRGSASQKYEANPGRSTNWNWYYTGHGQLQTPQIHSMYWWSGPDHTWQSGSDDRGPYDWKDRTKSDRQNSTPRNGTWTPDSPAGEDGRTSQGVCRADQTSQTMFYDMAWFTWDYHFVVLWNFFGCEDGHLVNGESTSQERGGMGYCVGINGPLSIDAHNTYSQNSSHAGDWGLRRKGCTFFSPSFRHDGSPDIHAGGDVDAEIVGHGDIYLAKGTTANPGWRMYVGYVYENGQESALTETPNFFNLPGSGFSNQHYSRRVYGTGWFNLRALHDGLSCFANPRIKGYRVYIEQRSSDPEKDVYITTSSKKLLCEVDYERGMRGAGSASWNPWQRRDTEWHAPAGAKFLSEIATDTYGGTAYNGRSGHWPDAQGHVHFCEATVRSIGDETFESIHGYPDKDIGSCYYKTAVVANGRTYVGNVKFDGVHYPDRMMKTAFGEYDVFTKQSFIDVTASDADTVVHLEAWRNFILQFKENVVHAIDISKELEMLKSSAKHTGVKNPCQVTQTEQGVVWASKNGLYAFDGEQIVNLFSEIGLDVTSALPSIASNATMTTSESRWTDLFTENSTQAPVVSYDPIEKNVIIHNQGLAGTNLEDVGFMWNIYRKNLTQFFRKFSDAQSITERSNSIITRDSKVVTVRNSIYNSYTSGYPTGAATSGAKFMKWNSAAQNEKHQILLYESPAIDFNNHAQRKTVYSLNFTYKANASTQLVARIEAFYTEGGPPVEYFCVPSGTTTSGTADLATNTFAGILPTTANKTETFTFKYCLPAGHVGAAVSIRSVVKKVTAIKVSLLKLSSTSYNIPSTFKLDDISITYKQKVHK